MLELSHLSHHFGSRQVLDDVTFSVAPGELVGFVGPNGAGKTTTMRSALGVLRPDRGEVRWQGEPVDHTVRRRFGYMPEERGLYPKMRIGEHLQFLGELRGMSGGQAKEASTRWMERLGVRERADDAIEKLSLGNQQRVQLAAALVHQPAALVLDEPFSGLDPSAVDDLAGVLEEETARGAAVVFSSHQLDLVERLCEKVAIIAEGRLLAFGEVDALRDEHGGRRVRVELENAGCDWAQELEGVGVVATDERGCLLELAGDVDPQQVLHAAQIAGRLRHFGYERPTLTELFREALAETTRPVPAPP
ncbi:MAG: ATP-binding cassette domain-containing protein [Solirubrobacteraceae bacterium MAG38_C4-C5]|nr:ATP-binding cassette domain-containing protein [Candidatus Siliceabacter maunaloa]